MNHELERQLHCLANLIKQVGPDDYVCRLESLHGSTIGQHMRHCIEFVQCAFHGIETGVVCYDDRRRDQSIEEEPNAALEAIEQLLLLNQQHADLEMTLCSRYPAGTVNAKTTLLREIMFNIEHIVHHQAIIKTAIQSVGVHSISKDFGVAASTLAHHQHVHVQSTPNT